MPILRDGDDWRLDGHKVWTSLAHFAKWMIVLVRHSSDHKYKGLSYFVVPIEGHEGVTVRPLIKMTGETGFNEVIFDKCNSPVSVKLSLSHKSRKVSPETPSK